MKTMKWIGGAAVTLAALGLVCPQAVQAGQVANARQNAGLRMVEAGAVQLGEAGLLRGALVDSNGRGVEKAPVIAVRQGRVLGQTQTDDEGRFEFKNLTAGELMVATHDGIYRYQLVSNTTVDASLKQGAIIKVDPDVARGKLFSPMNVGLLATLAIAGIVAGIIVATDDDDDAS